jgi:3-oxoadipyl-CoA thiolase
VDEISRERDRARDRQWRAGGELRPAIARPFAGGRVRRAVVIAAVRTPIGRHGGALSGIRPDDLAAIAIGAAIERSGVDPGEIEDVWFGAANQAGEDNRNVARTAALLAGLPDSVGGVTVNRLCASGLSAVVGACHAIVAGDGDLLVAGGVESMSRAPYVLAKASKAFPRGEETLYDTTLGWRFPNPRLAAMFPLESMGETGENVAERWSVSREDQDSFALESQRRYAQAHEAGRFADELVTAGELEHDEQPRPDTSAEKLAALKPVFRAGGTVTAGNASGIDDGAAALVIASEECARALGVEPLGTFLGSAVSGVDPRVMGIGPVPAVRRLLARSGVALTEIDLVELNEAFASQSIAVIRELGLDPERVNVNGGAIALGHPLGMSGARLVVSLLHELRRRGGRYGLATLCVGVGQGQAALFERPAR